MTEAQRTRIHSLIDEVLEAAGSERNRARGKERPPACFGMEDPIAWTHLFGCDIGRYFTDPAYYFESVLQQKLWRWKCFPEEEAPLSPDVPAWLGHYPEYTFVGLTVDFNASGVPIIQNDHPLTRDPCLSLMKPVDFSASGWMPRILRWHESLLKIAEDRVAVPFGMTWGRGGLDMAVQLRGYENFVADAVERPAFVRGLLGYLTEQRCRWYEAYYRHFGLAASPVGIADDWINVPFISPAMFADFVLPVYLEIERFHGGIASVHSCGNQTPVQRYLLRIESLQSLEVSPWTDLQASLQNIPAAKHLHIFLHPNEVLCASPEAMETQLTGIMQACRGRSHSIGTSGLTPIGPDMQEFIGKICAWIAAAQAARRRVYVEGRP